MDLTRMIRFIIDSRAECVDLIGGAINGVCRLTALSAEQIDQVELAVVEAVNNVVEHAYHQQPGHPVIVECQWMTDRLQVRVCDEGQTMDPQVLAAADDFAVLDPLDPESWNHRRRGLVIIRACTDAVAYSTNQGLNVLEMSIHLPPSPPNSFPQGEKA
jgi:serine/threonine-protein kinase RsbW